MTKREIYEAHATQLIMPVLEQNGFELVDVEYVKEGGNWYMRAYIDTPGGITIGDCETVSRYLSDRLDEKDLIEDAYVLEVSSPGLDRPLKKDKDLLRSIGTRVDVRLYKAASFGKEISGVLREFDPESITIETDEEQMLRIARGDIALVRLAFDF